MMTLQEYFYVEWMGYGDTWDGNDYMSDLTDEEYNEVEDAYNAYIRR